MLGTKRFALRRPQPSRGSAGRLAPFGALILMVFMVPGPAPAQRLPLPPDEQDAVNQAIDRGVASLKRTQQKNGTWPQAKVSAHGRHPVGYTALPALTLLECGVQPSDPIIQKAARFVRSKAANLDGTYELSLGILFLDRLGDPKDDKIIQTFALRLIAGQSATGGWGYRCPLINAPTQKELLTALRHLDTTAKEMPGMGGGIGKKPAELVPIAKAPRVPQLEGRAVQPSDPLISSGPSRGSPGEMPSTQADGVEPVDRWRDCLGLTILDSKEPESPNPPAKTDAKSAKDKSAKPYVIPERLRMLPVVQDPALHILQDPERKAADPIYTTTDNSNTQFAILALWTARRHDVPMNRSMNLIVRRFVTSQNTDGTWGYHYRFGGGDPTRTLTMTCVGLIGLAVGHGLAQPHPAGQPVQDPRIINGLIALSQTVGQPIEGPGDLPMQNLYYLWSLERVAVLYNLPTIGVKDWYRWGAQVLVRNQENKGDWKDGQYVGHSPTLDTCLALLFLKRANLVKDLTARLPFTAADLNKDIKEKLAPPPPTPMKKATKTIVPAELAKAEEPDNFVTKPPPSPANALESEIVVAGTDGGKKKWVIISLVVFLLFAGGSLYFLFSARRGGEEEGPTDNKRKKGAKKRKQQSTA